MKALTLTQPWATLVAIGAKKIETRSWKTDYRGPLAIHAAKALPRDWDEIVWHTPIETALHAHGYLHLHDDAPDFQYKDIPRGAVIAICNLVEWRPMDRSVYVENGIALSSNGASETAPIVRPDDLEFYFGDFRPGRYAWMLQDVLALPEPIPAKGSLGLWEWSPPYDITYLGRKESQ